MYLISLYLDEKSDKRIRNFMKQIAKQSGNFAMLEANVPPHITLAAFCTDSESEAEELFRTVVSGLNAGKVYWVTVGVFFPQVIFLSPVLNEYLQELSERIYKEISQRKNVFPRGKYGPWAWLPHATLAKRLTEEQMQRAFKVMQGQFAPFESVGIRLGLAKTNPYMDIEIYELHATEFITMDV